MGRLLGTLSPVRQRQLEQLAAGIDRYVGELDALRAEVAAVAAAAAAEGADTLAALTDAQLAALGDKRLRRGPLGPRRRDDPPLRRRLLWRPPARHLRRHREGRLHPQLTRLAPVGTERPLRGASRWTTLRSSPRPRRGRARFGASTDVPLAKGAP